MKSLAPTLGVAAALVYFLQPLWVWHLALLTWPLAMFPQMLKIGGADGVVSRGVARFIVACFLAQVHLN